MPLTSWPQFAHRRFGTPTGLGVSHNELRAELRRSRDAGLPICKGGRLQAPVRFYDERSKYGNVKRAAYVFKGREHQVPRVEAHRPARLVYW